MTGQRGLPYFPFYVNDFTSDGLVEAMTTEEVGAYVRLLCKAWRENPAGSIPDDDVILARWTRLSLQRWQKVKAAVLAPWRVGADGRLFQKRMVQEFGALMERSEKARAAADRKWELYASAKPEQCVGNASASIEHRSSIASQNQNQKQNQREREKERRPESFDQVRAFWAEESLSGDPAAFWDFYSSNGWMVGRNPMRDWKAGARSWSRRELSSRKGPQHTPGRYDNLPKPERIS